MTIQHGKNSDAVPYNSGVAFRTGNPLLPYQPVRNIRSVREMPPTRTVMRYSLSKNERPTKSSVDLSSLSVVMDFQDAAEPDTGAAFAVSILTRIATPEPAF